MIRRPGVISTEGRNLVVRCVAIATRSGCLTIALSFGRA